ncbi:hypothetical protein IMCC20628_01818 [Hoeflea sp. IMCC20628]|uniref:DUF192 domain-containing protein n=1 Tax=Hoeflea sp. IMCC20628 TaxID=1620421 RepID=UPI00063AFA14|nr:DUF192 domain-containing protein [Hoeflea sp. IMCC20628]AKI00527.1 hypothetical protein IMCC20628_01818 [Hoeflea sp. IMCC20628]
MRCFRNILALVFTFMFSAAAFAAPVDPERLVIETETGSVSFAVELALTPEERSIGLMYRPSMGAKHGMLFRFDQTRPVMMWMKNTPLALDMLFLDDSGTIVGIAPDTVPFSEDIISSPGHVRYVLELNAGTARRHGILVGDRARHRAIGK